MRGTQNQKKKDRFRIRITPAHAGNTPCGIEPPLQHQDHPRPCGEHSSLVGNANFSLGSPPPMRGTRYFFQIHKLSARITPAHAGNTILEWQGKPLVQDHPRPCGEHTKKILKLGPFCAAACHNLFSSQ